MFSLDSIRRMMGLAEERQAFEPVKTSTPEKPPTLPLPKPPITREVGELDIFRKATLATAESSFVPPLLRREKGDYGHLLSVALPTEPSTASPKAHFAMTPSAVIESKESEEGIDDSTEIGGSRPPEAVASTSFAEPIEPTFSLATSAFSDEDEYVCNLAKENNISGINDYISLMGFNEDKLGWATRVAARHGNLETIKTILSKGSIHPDHISESFVIAAKFGQNDTLEFFKRYPITQKTIKRAMREALKNNKESTVVSLSRLLVRL